MSETLILSTDKVRETAKDWIKRAPDGSKVTFERPRRSNPQNDLFWSLLGQLASKATYHGLRLSKEDWRTLFVSGIKKELRVVMSLNNDGLVPLDNHSSRLSVAEMAACIELIEAWAATNDVVLVRKVHGYNELTT